MNETSQSETMIQTTLTVTTMVQVAKLRILITIIMVLATVMTQTVQMFKKLILQLEAMIPITLILMVMALDVRRTKRMMLRRTMMKVTTVKTISKTVIPVLLRKQVAITHVQVAVVTMTIQMTGQIHQLRKKVAITQMKMRIKLPLLSKAQTVKMKATITMIMKTLTLKNQMIVKMIIVTMNQMEKRISKINIV